MRTDTPPQPTVSNDGLDLAGLARIVWRSKVVVCLVSLVGGLIALYFALTATHIYRAEIVVTEVRDNGVGGAAGLLSGQLGGLAGLADLGGFAGNENFEARAVLMSRHLVEEFIKQHDLLPVLFDAPNPKVPPTVWFGVKRFREDVLSIREDKRSGTTTVSMDWRDAAVAATWANDFVALANQLLRSRAVNESKRSIAYLNDQVSRTNVVEVQQVMYNLIENETKKLMFANVRSQYAFAVADPAVKPERRIKPQRALMVLAGLAIGFFLGTLAMVARELWRPRLRPAQPGT